MKHFRDIGYLLWDFFKEPWGHLFIGYLILLACKGSDLVLLTEMNGKLVSHVLLSAYWHWQFSRLEKCQVRQHSLSWKFSCLLVSVMHLYTFTLQFALVSQLMAYFNKNIFKLGEVIVKFKSHYNFITKITHLLPLQSDQNPSTSFTFSKSLVKGDPLVMYYAFLLWPPITLVRNECTYLDF